MTLSFVILLCAFVAYGFSKITLQNGLESTEITMNDLSSFSEVLVQAQFNYIDNDRYQKMHLCVRASNKHKKQAYVDLLKKYNGVVQTLVKLKAIPNKQTMIHSIVHRGYHKKSRKWEFFRYFVIYAIKEDIPLIQQRLKIFRPETVRTDPIIHYLDEKFMSIAAFIEAKLQLQKFIKEHLNNEYKILLTKDIQIIGQQVDNEQIIEQDLQDEFNEMNVGQNEEDSAEIAKETKEIEGYYAGSFKKGFRKNRRKLQKIEMKVLFQLVQKSADIEDILEGIQQRDDESQSISDFEDQLKNEQWKQWQQQQFDEQGQFQEL